MISLTEGGMNQPIISASLFIIMIDNLVPTLEDYDCTMTKSLP